MADCLREPVAIQILRFAADQSALHNGVQIMVTGTITSAHETDRDLADSKIYTYKPLTCTNAVAREGFGTYQERACEILNDVSRKQLRMTRCSCRQAGSRLAAAGHLPVEAENPYWTGNGAVTVEDRDGWRVVLMPHLPAE